MSEDDSSKDEVPVKSCENGHKAPVEWGSRDRKNRIKNMTCQNCGVNWKECY